MPVFSAPAAVPGNPEVQLHYRDEGQGPALLLAHSFGSSASSWQPQVEALRDSYRLISWDLRGHAGSDSPADEREYSEQACVSDMKALLDRLGVQQAVVGGLSLGGYLSLAFHLAHPERVRALVLFSCGPGYRNAEARAGWNRFAHKLADRLDDKGLSALGGDAEISLDEHRSAPGLALAARGILTQFDDRIIRSLDQIQVPTLVLVGENDPRYHPATTYLAQKIPTALHQLIPEAAHACNLHNPNAFNHHLTKFLTTLP